MLPEKMLEKDVDAAEITPDELEKIMGISTSEYWERMEIEINN